MLLDLVKVVHKFQVAVFKLAILLLLVKLETFPISLHLNALRLQRLDRRAHFGQAALIFVVRLAHRVAHAPEILELPFNFL